MSLREGRARKQPKETPATIKCPALHQDILHWLNTSLNNPLPLTTAAQVHSKWQKGEEDIHNKTNKIRRGTELKKKRNTFPIKLVDAGKSLVKPRIPTVQVGPKAGNQRKKLWPVYKGNICIPEKMETHMAQPYREFTLLPEGHARDKVKPEWAHSWMQSVKCASQTRKVEAKCPPCDTSRPPFPLEWRRNLKRDSP